MNSNLPHPFDFSLATGMRANTPWGPPLRQLIPAVEVKAAHVAVFMPVPPKGPAKKPGYDPAASKTSEFLFTKDS